MRIPPLSKQYEGKTVLDLPEIDLPDGKITAVIGANGSGKTTFARILSGLEKSDTRFSRVPSSGIMLQKSYAFRMSTEKNILLNGTDPKKAAELMNALGLTQLASARAQKLSGGETARMALARTLIRHYDLLILDEPTASMDMESTLISEELIKKYCVEEPSTVILITHSIQQAKRIADHILFLSHGRLTEAGPVEKVLTSPEEEETKAFLKFY